MPGRLRERWGAWNDLLKMRLNLLVVLTTLAGFYLASDGFADGAADVRLAAVLLLGTTLTASCAAVLNQVWERDLDARMPRTRRRPLPAGTIGRRAALVTAAGLGVAGTGLLAAFVNLTTAGLGLLTVALYVLVYTPMKTRTPWCTLVGAVPGAVPPVMGCAAAGELASWEAAGLFLILLTWQMPHFWGLAVLFRDDYAAAGMRMLPVVEAPALTRTKRSILIWTGALLAASLVPYFTAVTDGVYPAVAAALGGLMLAAGANAALARPPGRREARGLFLASIAYLPLLLAVLAATRR